MWLGVAVVGTAFRVMFVIIVEKRIDNVVTHYVKYDILKKNRVNRWCMKKIFINDGYYTGDVKVALEKIGYENLTKQEVLSIVEDVEALSALGFTDKDKDTIEKLRGELVCDIIIDEILEEEKQLNNQHKR